MGAVEGLQRGLAPRDAAALAWDSGQDAFGPTPTWRQIASHGVRPVSPTARTTATAATGQTVPAAARAMLAAGHRQNQLR